eukprot:1987195-Prymnesium_polylepis.1
MAPILLHILLLPDVPTAGDDFYLYADPDNMIWAPFPNAAPPAPVPVAPLPPPPQTLPLPNLHHDYTWPPVPGPDGDYQAPVPGHYWPPAPDLLPEEEPKRGSPHPDAITRVVPPVVSSRQS